MGAPLPEPRHPLAVRPQTAPPAAARQPVTPRRDVRDAIAKALTAAKPLGIPFDSELESREARATVVLRGPLEQQLYQVQDPAAGVDSLQFSLMQMNASGVAATPATDSLLHHIAAMQRKEGDWPNYGVARPPLENGGFSHTAKGIRALRLYAIPARRAEFDDRVARAAAWLERAEPLTTEDRAMQLLGLAWAGRKAPAARVRQLAAKQRADGGWGQTVALPSDAYASSAAASITSSAHNSPTGRGTSSRAPSGSSPISKAASPTSTISGSRKRARPWRRSA